MLLQPQILGLLQVVGHKLLLVGQLGLPLVQLLVLVLEMKPLVQGLVPLQEVILEQGEELASQLLSDCY